MSAGHAYRPDGWCAHGECVRHQTDPADFGFCPDTSGYDVRTRPDVPSDKQDLLVARRKKLVMAGFAVAATWLFRLTHRR